MNFSLNRTTVVVIGFLILIGYLLWAEHSAHIALAIPYLPWLILLACPLLHIFMHRGHGHGGHGKKDEPTSRNPPEISDAGRLETVRTSQTGGRHE